MMKCDDFKFEYTVAPGEIKGDACEHMQACDACQAFVKEEAKFQKVINSLYINSEVPDGFRHSVREHVVNNSSSFWSLPKSVLALAASLIAAIGLVNFNDSHFMNPDLPMDQMIVEHFRYDGSMSMNVSHEISEQELTEVSQQFGVRVKQGRHVSFVEKCAIGGSYGLHMVYQYRGQPITIIYMPDMSPSEPLPFNYAGLKGWVKPLKKGSMAVLAGSTAELPSVEYADQSIEWL